jgi:hypothetical protein
VEAAIHHTTDNGAFDMALDMSKKLPKIYILHRQLEYDERFREARRRSSPRPQAQGDHRHVRGDEEELGKLTVLRLIKII